MKPLRDYVGDALREAGVSNEFDDDPRDEVPPAESLEEFGSHPDQSDECIEKSNGKMGKSLVAFPLRAFGDIRLDSDQRHYLVKGLIAKSGLAVIWGPPKCGKSFWAADLGMHIALGWDYRGHKVQQATVIYIALEGRHGFTC